tara:strand:- start:284 stop:1129 length:846 start_codon:yes stop_codon:yes gene_type:complete
MKKEKLLIFIVAYNHEKTIKNVIDRIPKNLKNLYILEILIIDDNSKDNTFEISKKIKKDHKKKNIFNINIFYNPVNQGYGGNQKLGYHYAIKKNFKYVVLLHGDGQYAPEVLPKLLNQTLKNNVVMGSRMINKKLALKGGMPVYKFIGNIILTRLQNFLLGTGLAEFHTGYRIYLVKSLKKIPFYLNTNDFHFDTEILIQLVINKDSIKEISIPTFYGDEICHVNGTKYAFNVLRMTLTAKIQKISKLILTEKFNIKKKTKNYLFSYKRVDNLLKLSMKRK